MSWLVQVAFWWGIALALFALFVVLNARRPKKQYPKPPAISEREAHAFADFVLWDAEFRGLTDPKK